jgi:hypothetical protein
MVHPFCKQPNHPRLAGAGVTKHAKVPSGQLRSRYSDFTARVILPEGNQPFPCEHHVKVTAREWVAIQNFQDPGRTRLLGHHIRYLSDGRDSIPDCESHLGQFQHREVILSVAERR